jgi:hypothetical protein
VGEHLHEPLFTHQKPSFSPELSTCISFTHEDARKFYNDYGQKNMVARQEEGILETVLPSLRA